MTNQERFENLPIVTDDREYKDGWNRAIKRRTTIKELLETWDIGDPEETSEMAQVLRHLRDFVFLVGPVR